MCVCVYIYILWKCLISFPMEILAKGVCRGLTDICNLGPSSSK